MHCARGRGGGVGRDGGGGGGGGRWIEIGAFCVYTTQVSRRGDPHAGNLSEYPPGVSSSGWMGEWVREWIGG